MTKAEFAHEQAKIYLESLVHASEVIDGKVFVFLGFCVTLINAVIGYAIYLYLENPAIFLLHILIMIFLFIYAVLLLVPAILLAIAVCARDHLHPGNEPENLLDGIAKTMSSEELIEAETRSYTHRINKLHEVLAYKAKLLNWSIFILILLPVILTIAYAVTSHVSAVQAGGVAYCQASSSAPGAVH